MRQLTLAIVFAWGLLAGPLVPAARAVTVEELLSLKANGLSDDILVALIESDGSVFQLTSDDVVSLHQRGLGEKVILAMIATARKSPAPVPDVTITPTPMQQTVIHPFQLVNNSPVEVYAPVAVPVTTIYAPVSPHRFDRPHRLNPLPTVYWGFGGQLRPDAWRPVVARTPVSDRRGADADRRPVERDTPPPAPPARRR
jgi:hypothetical protein